MISERNQNGQNRLPLEKVAQFIRRLSRQEQRQLLALVPELRDLSLADAPLAAEQRELMAYFVQQLDPDEPLLDDHAPFLQGLTVAEFFQLDPVAQDHLWAAAHEEAAAIYADHEQPVRADALPAR